MVQVDLIKICVCGSLHCRGSLTRGPHKRLRLSKDGIENCDIFRHGYGGILRKY